MKYQLLKDVINLTSAFEQSTEGSKSTVTIDDFKAWVAGNFSDTSAANEPDWEGKKNGRSPESVINTLIVHMNRYAKNYSRSAIYGSDFSTQEDFIYLINLKSFGKMSKMDLIKKNVQDKPVGMQTINRLISKGWVEQQVSQTDKRSKLLQITSKGLDALEKQMYKIRQATRIIAGDLSYREKIELIRLLGKLDSFHHNIYSLNLDTSRLLNEALKIKNQREL